MSDFLGERRLPFLVLDSRQVLRNRAMFSARGAGILGFSIFGTRPCYALDEHMELNGRGAGLPGGAPGGDHLPLRLHLHHLEACRPRPGGAGERLDIPNGILVHGGGWKKLAGEAVSPGEFKARVAAATGVERVSNYYGMAEQTGCVSWSAPGPPPRQPVVGYRGAAGAGLRPCEPGEEGVLQVLSPLPRSYPGHSLLTGSGRAAGGGQLPLRAQGQIFQGDGAGAPGRGEGVQRYL